MTPQTIAETESIDHERTVWHWLHTHGLPADRLVDPSLIEEHHIGDDGLDRLRVVSVDERHGPSEHPIGADSLTDDVHNPVSDTGVVWGANDYVQPIGFDNLLNTDREYPCTITVFAFGERSYPDLTPERVLDALDRVDATTPIRRPTVDAWADAFGLNLTLDDWGWHADDHGDWIRAEWVPSKFVAAIDGLETQSPDTDISGKKRIARQRFGRNRSQLEQWGAADA